MSTAHQYRPNYCVEDYLQWKGDWELWNGFAIAMSPSPFGVHQRIIVNLITAIKNALTANHCDSTVLCELDWIVNSSTVVRPDVIVVCGHPPDQHLHSAPGLIAEILSPSTRQNDLTYKRDLYEREHVGTYLIIDPADESITINELKEGRYHQKHVTGEVLLTPCDGCSISVASASIFGR